MKKETIIKLNPNTAIVQEKQWEAGATILRNSELTIESIVDDRAILRRPDGTLDGMYPITDLINSGWSLK